MSFSDINLDNSEILNIESSYTLRFRLDSIFEIFVICPVDKSSIIVTSSPLPIHVSAKWDPINPHPPVISIFTLPSFTR